MIEVEAEIKAKAENREVPFGICIKELLNCDIVKLLERG